MLKHFNFRQWVTHCLMALLPLLPTVLQAQAVEQWRGGWMADVAGVRHVLYLVLRDGKVSGFHCADCYDPDHLAFVDDGVLAGNALHFRLYHGSAGKATVIEQADAVLANGELQLTLKPPHSAAVHIAMKRSTPGAPAVVDRSPSLPAGGGPRILPAAATTISAEKVLGLWLWGAGPGKQYFIFKRHKHGIRGMVCGPCENPKDFAPLENISMNGNQFHFDIVHEDNGGGYQEHGPFSNVTEAELAMNELQLTSRPSFDPDSRKIEMNLLGPVRYLPRVKP